MPPLSAPPDGAVAIGQCLFDDAAGLLTREGQVIPLRAKSFALLRVLVSQAGRVVTKDRLLDAVWPEVTVTEDSLTQAIRDIRRALGEADGRLLRNVSGRGYMLELPPMLPADVAGLPRVVVLPLRDGGGQDSRRPLLDLLTETISGGLARFRSLAVIARHSAFAAAATGDHPAAVAARLRADFIVEGTAWPGPRGLRLSFTLSDAAAGRIIWSDSYDCDGEAMLSLQDVVPRQIVVRLVRSVEAEAGRQAERQPPGRLTACALFARGLSHLRSYGAGENEAARDLFAQAIQADPSFAPAHSLWACAEVLSNGFNLPRGPVLDRIRAAAARAADLAPDDALVVGTFGWIRALCSEFAAAEATLHRAVALNPCLAETLHDMAFVCILRSRPQAALDWLDRATAINPLAPPHYDSTRAEALFMLGNYAAAAEALRRMPRLHDRQWVRLAAALALAGDRAGAASALRAAEAIAPGIDLITRARDIYLYEDPREVEHMIDGIRLAQSFLA